MTDVLNLGHEALDDFTSTQETAPKPAAAAPASATCHFCSSTFEGPARWFQRGRHEKDKHHDQWLASKAGVKPKAKKSTAKAQPKPKAPVTGRVTGPKRISASETIARNLGRVAKLVAQVDAPLGRALVFSAPATGQAVDELVAGTVVDRIVLQKFAGAADKWEKFGGVIAFPVLIAIVSRNPALFDVLEDDLRDATLDVIISSIPTLEKQKAKEKKAVDALRRLGQIDERYAITDDPIGLILRDLFATPTEANDDGEAV
jgi:hypothetical protein